MRKLHELVAMVEQVVRSWLAAVREEDLSVPIAEARECAERILEEALRYREALKEDQRTVVQQASESGM